jgi:TRAP-type uncharacterized transport system substrate-binding protein
MGVEKKEKGVLNMSRRKFFALLCTLAMLLGLLTACGGETRQESETEDTEQTEAEGEVETRYLTMSAVASSSGLFPYCVAIGDVLSNLPELEITVAESGGNVANTQELRIGEVSIANSMRSISSAAPAVRSIS